MTTNKNYDPGQEGEGASNQTDTPIAENMEIGIEDIEPNEDDLEDDLDEEDEDEDSLDEEAE